MNSMLRGVVAGAVGTLALDIVTYGDMVLRGRGSSDTPAQLAGKLTDALGIPLTDEAGDEGKTQAENRKSGIGALLGYGTGIGIGIASVLLPSGTQRQPVLARGLAVGLAAMAASDVPIVASGLSDPRTWGASGWLGDLIPHVVYGLVTVLVADALLPASPRVAVAM